MYRLHTVSLRLMWLWNVKWLEEIIDSAKNDSDLLYSTALTTPESRFDSGYFDNIFKRVGKALAEDRLKVTDIFVLDSLDSLRNNEDVLENLKRFLAEKKRDVKIIYKNSGDFETLDKEIRIENFHIFPNANIVMTGTRDSRGHIEKGYLYKNPEKVNEYKKEFDNIYKCSYDAQDEIEKIDTGTTQN